MISSPEQNFKINSLALLDSHPQLDDDFENKISSNNNNEGVTASSSNKTDSKEIENINLRRNIFRFKNEKKKSV